MALPKIVYNAGSGPVALNFVRGPQDFSCYYSARVHDNLATSGVRERVMEARDILISFAMTHLRIEEDLAAWSVFMQFALGGAQFDFYPNNDLGDFYHCVIEGDLFEPRRTGPGYYGASFRLRVAPDFLAPAHPGVVLQRFYGVTA